MHKQRIIPFILIFLLAASFLGVRQPAQASTYGLPGVRLLNAVSNKIDPALQSALASLQPGEMLTVIVTLRAQADLSTVSGLDRAARQERVILALQSAANATQGHLSSLLAARRSQGLVKDFASFWVFNGFSVTASQSVIADMAQDPDVLSLSPDSLQIVPALAPAASNIAATNASALWALGDTGQGVVVANLDSGVDVSHPDLAARYRGGSNSWFDPYAQHAAPADLTGHGTQTMGIMLGGDASGTTLGMAPGAQWISAKIFNDSGSSTATAIHQSFQWLLDPDANPATADAPQVVNNSWSFATPGCNLDFEPDLQALRAAGILPVFAAGNYGPGSGTSASPANNPSAFAVGAIDANNQVYSSSSRGPNTCGGSTGVFPELVAPGVNVTTTDLFGLYYTASGTSFSAPHAAGALALLISANPNLSAADQESALLNGAADLGAAGPDDTYGFGALDVLAAYNWLVAGNHATPTPTPAPTFTPTPTATPLPTATPTPTAAPATTLHVGDLDGSRTLLSKSWTATVTILVHDNNENPVANATVAGKWSKGATGSVTCTTNSSGLCSVSKTGIKLTTSSVTFSVTGVTKSGLTYQSASNHDPDGDSTGTTILVKK